VWYDALGQEQLLGTMKSNGGQQVIVVWGMKGKELGGPPRRSEETREPTPKNGIRNSHVLSMQKKKKKTWESLRKWCTWLGSKVGKKPQAMGIKGRRRGPSLKLMTTFVVAPAGLQGNRDGHGRGIKDRGGKSWSSNSLPQQ